uniref:Uncharacterized protein n=2 Tax=Amphimedon queenslandica TaxID=400682 RepID=A0A1X7TWP4_AMPQE
THTLAVIKGEEKYDVIRNGLAPVIKEINEMVRKPSIIIQGVSYSLKFILGGDYKFLLLLLGMNAAHSNYSCIYCTIKKDKRFDTTVPTEEYETKQARSLASIKSCAKSKAMGVLREPLFEIELEQVVIDELHLLLRISDVLIRNLLGIGQALDLKDITTKNSTRHVDMICNLIQSCGITFHVWKSKTKKDELDWTSLRGSDRKKLLNELPAKLVNVFPNELGRQLMKHWLDFKVIYEMIGISNPTDDETLTVQSKALQWIQDFLKFPYDGYSKSNVTPYMHVMGYHIPHLMKCHAGIKRFSGQGVEKNNDCARKHFFSSNHQDAARDILLTDSRVEELQHGKRAKRKYEKKDTSYWELGIREKRRKIEFEPEPDLKPDTC